MNTLPLKRFSHPFFSIFLAALLTLSLSACADGGGEAETGEIGADTALADQPAGMQQDTMQQGGMGDGMFETTAATYSEWDADTNTQLSEDEFWSGVWNEWDADASGDLTETEFNEGSTEFFGEDYQYGWSDWDADGDGTLTETEFNKGWSQYDEGFYDDWDTDDSGWLSEEEFTAGTFGGQQGGGM